MFFMILVLMLNRDHSYTFYIITFPIHALDFEFRCCLVSYAYGRSQEFFRFFISVCMGFDSFLVIQLSFI